MNCFLKKFCCNLWLQTLKSIWGNSSLQNSANLQSDNDIFY